MLCHETSWDIMKKNSGKWQDYHHHDLVLELDLFPNDDTSFKADYGADSRFAPSL